MIRRYNQGKITLKKIKKVEKFVNYNNQKLENTDLVINLLQLLVGSFKSKNYLCIINIYLFKSLSLTITRVNVNIDSKI